MVQDEVDDEIDAMLEAGIINKSGASIKKKIPSTAGSAQGHFSPGESTGKSLTTPRIYTKKEKKAGIRESPFEAQAKNDPRYILVNSPGNRPMKALNNPLGATTQGKSIFVICRGLCLCRPYCRAIDELVIFAVGAVPFHSCYTTLCTIMFISIPTFHNLYAAGGLENQEEKEQQSEDEGYDDEYLAELAFIKSEKKRKRWEAEEALRIEAEEEAAAVEAARKKKLMEQGGML